jgi:hypothetical protein
VRTPAFASGHVRTLAPHAGCVRWVTKPVLVQMLAGSGRPDFENTGDPGLLLTMLAHRQPEPDFRMATP